MITSDLLLLIDSRLPAGGHAHSSGVAPAIEQGFIKNGVELESFLRTKLLTNGFVSASAVHLSAIGVNRRDLEKALDARMASPVARLASRAQGKGLLRVAKAVWPTLPDIGEAIHHPIVFGHLAAFLGASVEAPTAYLHQSLMNGTSTAIRLLGLDPISMSALISRINIEVPELVKRIQTIKVISQLPSLSAPGLEMLAQIYSRAEVRLFAS